MEEAGEVFLNEDFADFGHGASGEDGMKRLGVGAAGEDVEIIFFAPEAVRSRARRVGWHIERLGPRIWCQRCGELDQGRRRRREQKSRASRRSRLRSFCRDRPETRGGRSRNRSRRRVFVWRCRQRSCRRNHRGRIDGRRRRASAWRRRRRRWRCRLARGFGARRWRREGWELQRLRWWR